MSEAQVQQPGRPTGRTLRRRGMALYLTVLSVSVLVVGTGLTLISVQRSERRLQDNIVRNNDVKWYARAGIEQALLYMEQQSNWRSLVTSNKLINALTIGDGTVTVEVYDDADGSLTDNDAEPVRLVSTAVRQGATSKISVQLTARPHPALRYAVFNSSSSALSFSNSNRFRGPVRSHGSITAGSSNSITDDAAFETMTGYTIGSGLTPATYSSTAIAAPSPNLSVYTAMATAISGDYGSVCDIRGYNLTPTSNPTGAANANGIYLLNSGGRAVVFEDLHLRGTLIITGTNGNYVYFSEGCWIEPGPLNYPVLLIDNSGGAVYLQPDSDTVYELTTQRTLPINGNNVTTTGVDFDEDGYYGSSFSSHIRGVVWTNCAYLSVGTGSWNYVGSLIAPYMGFTNSIAVDNDLTLLNSPMPGFVQSGMRIVQGSFREVQ